MLLTSEGKGILEGRRLSSESSGSRARQQALKNAGVPTGGGAVWGGHTWSWRNLRWCGQLRVGSSGWAAQHGQLRVGSSVRAAQGGQLSAGSSMRAAQRGQFSMGSNFLALWVSRYVLGGGIGVGGSPSGVASLSADE